MPKADLICIDTMVLIAMVIGDEAKGEEQALAQVSTYLAEQAEKGQYKLLISEVTVAECCKLQDSSGLPDYTAVDAFLASGIFVRRPVVRAVSHRARSLIENCNLDACDAMILATGLEHGADLIYTHDGEMRKKLRKRQKPPATEPTKIDGVRVVSPLWDRELCAEVGIEPMTVESTKKPKGKKKPAAT